MTADTVSAALAEQAFHALGREVPVFGVVGNGNIHFVSHFRELGGKYISARHEAGAITAADAYYRATG